jgi:hypothetical protein
MDGRTVPGLDEFQVETGGVSHRGQRGSPASLPTEEGDLRASFEPVRSDVASGEPVVGDATAGGSKPVYERT